MNEDNFCQRKGCQRVLGIKNGMCVYKVAAICRTEALFTNLQKDGTFFLLARHVGCPDLHEGREGGGGIQISDRPDL
jgi:hypothetical protein